MTFIVCGLNHHTAPIFIREQASMTPDRVQVWYGKANICAHMADLFFLSTCNRTELYAITDSPDTLFQWFIDDILEAPKQHHPFFYMKIEDEALSHLIQVSAGVNARILGETQIFGQLKQAIQTAKCFNHIHQPLQSILQHAFNTIKKVRQHTKIGHFRTSIGRATADMITAYYPTIENRPILLIGAGDTTRLVAHYLYQRGARQLTITSRTDENATELANAVEGKMFPITALSSELIHFDIIVTATTCPLPFITKSLLKDATQHRTDPLLIMDLAIPRDVEAAVTELNNTVLFKKP